MLAWQNSLPQFPSPAKEALPDSECAPGCPSYCPPSRSCMDHEVVLTTGSETHHLLYSLQDSEAEIGFLAHGLRKSHPSEKGHKAIYHWEEQKQSIQRQGFISVQASHITLMSHSLGFHMAETKQRNFFPFQEASSRKAPWPPTVVILEKGQRTGWWREQNREHRQGKSWQGSQASPLSRWAMGTFISESSSTSRALQGASSLSSHWWLPTLLAGAYVGGWGGKRDGAGRQVSGKQLISREGRN